MHYISSLAKRYQALAGGLKTQKQLKITKC